MFLIAPCRLQITFVSVMSCDTIAFPIQGCVPFLAGEWVGKAVTHQRRLGGAVDFECTFSCLVSSPVSTAAFSSSLSVQRSRSSLPRQDLPEQPYLQPPLSVLVIERRAFGRTVLVGSHVVPRMLRFTLRGQEDAPEEQEEEETGDLVPRDPQGKGLSP